MACSRGTGSVNPIFCAVQYSRRPGQEIAAFAYLLDLSNDNGPPNSNATYGASYRGEFDFVTVDATFAQQSDWAENPMAYDAPHFISIQGAFRRGAGRCRNPDGGL